MDCQHDAPAGPWEMGTGKQPDVTNGYHWELYNIAEDYSQYKDLARESRQLNEDAGMFLDWAGKYNVFPMDNRAFARITTPRPSTVAEMEFTYAGEVPASLRKWPSILDRD